MREEIENQGVIAGFLPPAFITLPRRSGRTGHFNSSDRAATPGSLPTRSWERRPGILGGIHRSRLAASKAHRHFVKEVRRAVQKVGSQIPTGGLSPALVGAKPLALAVSPVFEVAFGYRGNLRFLEFGYNTASHQFGFSDGGDDLPSDASLWSWFLHHPVVSPLLPETQYPTLYGKFAPGTDHAPYTKGNFQFERVITGWRK